MWKVSESYLVIPDEPTARQISLVLCELRIRFLLRGSIASRSTTCSCSWKLVHGAQVVETTTGDHLTGRGERARHHPRRTKRDGVYLVSGECIPK